MKKITRYFTTFYYPGMFFAETSAIETDTMPDPEKVIFPENTYAFKIKKREDVIDNDNVYTGKCVDVGPMYYHPQSLILHIDRIRRRALPNEKTLLWNMEMNKWETVVQCYPFGNCQPFVLGEDVIQGHNDPFIAR